MPQRETETQSQSVFPPDAQPGLAYITLWTYEGSLSARTMHRHDSMCELLLTIEGYGLHTAGGQVFETQRGDLLVYNAGLVHEDAVASGGLERLYACGVTGLRLPGLPDNYLLPPDACVRQRTGTHFSSFENIFHLIYKHTREPGFHSPEIAARLLPVLLLLAMQLEQQENSSIQPESLQVNQMRSYIDIHYAEDISLDQIAAQAGISPYYASHLFKKYCSYSPVQYLIRRRIGEAQSLLLYSPLSITAIAAQTGFDSPNHFSTLFSKYTGYPPSAYRKTFRGK